MLGPLDASFYLFALADAAPFAFPIGMNDGQRLWNAILDRPFSRSLWQIYVDWLEEHGDPRAELIRLQDRAVPRDPWREVELLRSHEAEWLGSIAQHAQDWTFRHGLVTRVTVEAERFLAHGDEWTRRPGLLGVVLTKQVFV